MENSRQARPWYPPVDNPEDVDGETLREVAFRERLTQAALGQRFGVNQTTFSRWIREKNRIPEIIKHVMTCRRCYDHFVRERAMEEQVKPVPRAGGKS